MDKQELDLKMTEMAHSILSYCAARTPNHFEAEDLAQDIILEIYKSAASLRNDRAFYGFMWSTAGNVYKQWCKKKHRNQECSLNDALALEAAEEELETADGPLILLRRELSLLAAKYRRATILYYIENRSCLEIARMLSISESMVKYLLFKSRQLLKEVMHMERNYGQQSYNPKELALLYWGTHTNNYSKLCDSKISQNILFACYNDKLTPEQISVEIGVALPYMEDNLNALCTSGLLKKEGHKYYTNIVIFTNELSNEVYKKTVQLRTHIVDILMQSVTAREAQIRSIGFTGSDMGNNSFSWQITSILLHQAIIKKLHNQIDIVYPVDAFGNRCFVWGVENNRTPPCLPQFDFGTTNLSNKAGDHIQFMDFLINGEMVHHYYFNRQEVINIFLDIAKGQTDHFSENDRACAAEMVKKGYVRSESGSLSVNVPIFTKEQFQKLVSLLDEDTSRIASEAKAMMDEVAKILKNHIPIHLKKTAKDMAYLRLFDDTISAPVASLFERRYLLAYSGESLLPTTYVILNH